MLDDKDLFSFKKECLFQALQRNLEWAKRSNEISMQAKKWCIAYWLIYVGFFVKETNLKITWLQICIGLLGIFFFLAWELVIHHYSELIAKHRFTLNQYLVDLPTMTKEQLLTFAPMPVAAINTVTRKDRLIEILRMLSHETVLFFYVGLAFFMLVVFVVLRNQQ